MLELAEQIVLKIKGAPDQELALEIRILLERAHADGRVIGEEIGYDNGYSMALEDALNEIRGLS